MGPEFSVVVPTFNQAGVVGRAVRGILLQSVADLEVLVVDDGSADSTQAELAAIDDARLSVLSQPHAGASAARNLGARRAHGRWLAFLDSDDEADPGWLAGLAGVVRADVAIACCGANVVPLAQPCYGMRPYPLGPVFQDVEGLFQAGTFAVERELFLSVGGYAEALGFAENTELALRLLAAATAAGRTVAATQDQLVTLHGQEAGREPARYTRARFEAASYIVEQHRPLLRRDPAMLSTYLAIAGVEGARLGRYRDARAFFWERARLRPLSVKAWAQLAVSQTPGLRSLTWPRAG